MTTATTQAPDLDLDALEADAASKVREAEDAEARLSLDALNDPEVATALRDVRSERAAAEAELRQVALARSEQDRRTEAERQERDRKAKAKALAEAKALEAPLLATARKFDKAADQLARLAMDHRNAAEERARLLHRAGVSEHPWPGNGVSIYAAAIIEAWDAHGGIAAWAQWAGGKPTRLAKVADGFTEEVPT